MYLTELEAPTCIPTITASIPAPPLHWLGLKTLTYTVPDHPRGSNAERSYEAVYRTRHGAAPKPGISAHELRNQRGRHDANDIIATTVSKTTPELHNRVVIVMQYRPAVNAYTLEFPAGCIDPHETDAMASALRELKEETGLTAQPSSVSSAYMFTYEPGITSSCGMAVTCTIDMDDPVTAMPTPHLEDGEWSLCTYLLPLDGLAARLQAFVAAHEHVMLDSRLGAFALGLQYASSLHLPAAAK